jgi:phospholipase/carboxylesterase
MLHGRNMQAADLAPFGASLGVDARFIFPDAPLAAEPGRTWWPVASEARLREQGARDLHAMDPPGRVEARAMLDVLCNEVGTDKRLVLVGFSQGGMLAMDYVLHGGRVDALALLSSTRIAFDEWQPLLPRLAGLPVLVAHGREDQELSFAAGEALRDAAIAGGAEVTWLPFDGGHGIPLPVWRGLRRFLQGPA